MLEVITTELARLASFVARAAVLVFPFATLLLLQWIEVVPKLQPAIGIPIAVALFYLGILMCSLVEVRPARGSQQASQRE